MLIKFCSLRVGKKKKKGEEPKLQGAVCKAKGPLGVGPSLWVRDPGGAGMSLLSWEVVWQRGTGRPGSSTGGKTKIRAAGNDLRTRLSGLARGLPGKLLLQGKAAN